MNIEKTAIVGAGAWGTALAWLWGKNGREISLWGHNGGRVLRMQETRENTDYLPGIKLPESVRVTSELRDCAGADLIVFVTPSAALREIATRLRIYTTQDVVSVELGGALKNIFALAAGISDGLGLGDNSKAALVTRSLTELVRLGVAMDGNANAFYGLSGAGDLVLTCYSERSRNHTVGKRLGCGESLAQITASMKTVAEGIPTTRSAWECARRLSIVTPIIDEVYAVLYEQKRPTVALEELLRREQKAEQL